MRFRVWVSVWTVVKGLREFRWFDRELSQDLLGGVRCAESLAPREFQVSFVLGGNWAEQKGS